MVYYYCVLFSVGRLAADRWGRAWRKEKVKCFFEAKFSDCSLPTPALAIPPLSTHTPVLSPMYQKKVWAHAAQRTRRAGRLQQKKKDHHFFQTWLVSAQVRWHSQPPFSLALARHLPLPFSFYHYLNMLGLIFDRRWARGSPGALFFGDEKYEKTLLSVFCSLF
jgi:hypothetical protein